MDTLFQIPQVGRTKPSEDPLEALKASQKQEIRVECNMEEFPYFRLSKKDSKTFNKIYYAREVKNEKGGALKQRWVVVADSELGLPGPFDQDVYVAMETIIDEVGIHPDGYVPFTCYRITQLLGKDHSGRTYQAIRTALMRMVSTRITSEKAFYLRDEKVHISETFHLYDSVRFEERVSPKRSKAAFEYNLLFPCRWYIESRRQKYTKPLDLNIYKLLKSPTAKKLFRYLDKRRFSNPEAIAIDLFQLSDALPLTPSFPSKLKQVLEVPHKQLLEVGFVNGIEFVQIDRRNWKIVYSFPKDMPTVSEDSRHSPMAELLISRGLTEKAATFLASQYPERVHAQVEAFNWLVENKSPQVQHNPAGYLRKAIEDNYAIPEGFISEGEKQEIVEEGKQEAERRRKEQEAEDKTRYELKSRIEQVKANLSPEELKGLSKEAEENLNHFVKQRFTRDMEQLGYLSQTSQAALEYELDRVIENRYLNIPGSE